MAEERKEGESSLRLTIISARDLKLPKLFGKTKCLALAWIDPRLKRSTKSTPTSPSNSNRLVWNDSLTFPISLDASRNPNLCLTIQLLSVSAMKMIRHERLIGSAILSLTDVRFHRLDFTLQVWRPSGRAQGLLLVSAWIDCDLRISPAVIVNDQSCVTGIPVEFSSATVRQPLILDPTDVDESRYAPHAIPSAPVEMESLTQEPETDIDYELDRPVSQQVETSIVSSDLRNLLIGFVGGAVAAAAAIVIVLARKR